MLLLHWPHPQVHVCTGRQSCLPFCSWSWGEWCYTLCAGAFRDAARGQTGFRWRGQISDVTAWAWHYKVGLLKLHRWSFSLCDYSWEIHSRMEIIWAEATLGKEVRAWSEMLAKWEEKPVCHTCSANFWFFLIVMPVVLSLQQCCHSLPLKVLERTWNMFCVLNVFIQMVNCLCVLTWNGGCVALWHVWACTLDCAALC